MDTGLLQCLVTCLPNCVVSYDHLAQPFYMRVANKQNPDYAIGIRLVYLKCHSSLIFCILRTRKKGFVS